MGKYAEQACDQVIKWESRHREERYIDCLLLWITLVMKVKKDNSLFSHSVKPKNGKMF